MNLRSIRFRFLLCKGEKGEAQEKQEGEKKKNKNKTRDGGMVGEEMTTFQGNQNTRATQTSLSPIRGNEKEGYTRRL